MFVVLISRHFWDDEFTTQFEFITEAFDTDHARVKARLKYSPEYLPWIMYGENFGRLAAHFTGKIYKR